MTLRFRIAALDATHDRNSFSCGEPALDSYLRERATQDTRRRFSKTYVALASDGRIAGYYTLSASSIALADLPEEDTRRLPRYDAVPAALIGRLAVSLDFRGLGLGTVLVADAAQRADRSAPAIHVLVVDATDEAAESFYRHLHFRAFGKKERKLFIPLDKALKALRAEN